ncbi:MULTISPECIES: lytic transglycosylase domain-containing protein [unclassified Nocardia]|uniref:lytic transglycosylase domain-containing protein n=1 Tax=unclassified Nocardia TaxID=2637762 RepID=UPI001CE3EB2B|nr:MULTISPECIES: lytic murein transglycosylase [unclassified Nocardia]
MDEVRLTKIGGGLGRGAGLITSLVLVLLIAACGGGSGPFGPSLPPIPDTIPPGPGTPLPPIDVNGPGRTAIQLEAWAQPQASALGIPVLALEAYGYAAAVLAQSRPGCGIAWTTLAGIARVETQHGSHGGSRIGPDGKVDPPIRGPLLDGSPGVAKVLDNEATAKAGHEVYARAMGPFQFIQETWQRWGVDANGDGVADPDNIDDAALTAARYLCASGGDLTSAEGWQKALWAYNQSNSYMLDVRKRAAAYSVGRRS